MKRLLVFVFAVALLGSCTESVTLIPDENFEKALIELGYDDTLDGGVLTSNINGIVALWIDEKDIHDLTGIEDFTALIELDCGSNQFTSLDVSKNTALEELYCDNNQLTSLNVSNNTALTKLQCQDNRLTNLDLSNNPALTLVLCGKNNFDSKALKAKYNLK